MNKTIYKIFIAALMCALFYSTDSFSQAMNNETKMPDGTVVDIKTSLGDIKVLLYNDTPLHRDNFIKLVKDGFYDGVLFHRVINNFMVQTGDPKSKDAAPGQHLGAGDPGYTIEAEILYPKHFHKYGALAAARTGDQFNPERRSSGSQFYIVTGNKYSDGDVEMLNKRYVDSARQNYFRKLVEQHLSEIEALRAAADEEGLENMRLKLIEETEAAVPAAGLPEEVTQAYTTVGGTPHLDGQYTVFGEVISGMDVIEKIQTAATDNADRPTEDIKIISASLATE